jgi:actin-related protein
MTGDVTSSGASDTGIIPRNDGLRIYALLGSATTHRYGYNTFEADAEL